MTTGQVTHGDVNSASSVLGAFALNTIYNISCLDGMASLPAHSVDVAIADPPYNASKGGEWKWDNSVALPGFGGDWRKVSESWDTMDLTQYVRFTVEWLTHLKRVVKPTGSIWIHGTYHNIGIINFVLQTLDIEIINEVVWYKRNSFPNLSGRRLTASHETILWAHTGKRREYFFDYDCSKSLDCPEDALRSPGKQMRTVWDIPNNKDRSELLHGKHPTQKPLRLLTRMLRLSAQPGSICLAPFSGSGSECVAAAHLGLSYIGFETDPAYVDLARRRIAHGRTNDKHQMPTMRQP
jgi:site-specific DNA-methyltransferase (adenine-specific)